MAQRELLPLLEIIPIVNWTAVIGMCEKTNAGMKGVVHLIPGNKIRSFTLNNHIVDLDVYFEIGRDHLAFNTMSSPAVRHGRIVGRLFRKNFPPEKPFDHLRMGIFIESFVATVYNPHTLKSKAYRERSRCSSLDYCARLDASDKTELEILLLNAGESNCSACESELNGGICPRCLI